MEAVPAAVTDAALEAMPATANHETCCIKSQLSGGMNHGPRCLATTAARLEGRRPRNLVWQVRLSAEWTKLTNNKENECAILAAEEAGEDQVHIRERGFVYLIDFVQLKQINTRSGKSLDIRLAEFVDDWEPMVVQPRSARLQALVEHLMSSMVQVPLTADLAEANEPERLTADEVRNTFINHAPGVESFLYRGIRGKYSLDMVVDAYFNGIPAFKGSTLHGHLLSLLRLIVHEAHDGKLGAASRLRDVAEAFMDCMAVQGRIVQRVGSEIKGVASDFRSRILHLVGYQKEIALKTLAVEHVRQGLAADDRNKPTHYENRLTADLGVELGLNADDVRQARMDSHAGRFGQLTGDTLRNAATRCRELFDVSALLQSLVSEINSFSAESQPESLPCLFMAWVAEYLSEPHAIFSADDPYRLDVDESLVLACLEQLFLGDVSATAEDHYHGQSVRKLFEVGHSESNDDCHHRSVASEGEASAKIAINSKPEPSFPSMRLVAIIGFIALSLWVSRLTQ